MPDMGITEEWLKDRIDALRQALLEMDDPVTQIPELLTVLQQAKAMMETADHD